MSDSEQVRQSPLDDCTTPRLGIRHLMLWGAATAVVMSLHSTIRLINGEPVQSRTYLFELVGGTAYGAALAGILIGLWRWRKGRRVVIHPGHLFLYLAGIAMLLDLGLTLGLSLWAQGHGKTFNSYIYHRHLIGYGASAVVVVVAIVRMRLGLLWCLPLIALLLLSLSQFVGAALEFVDEWRPILQRHWWLAPYWTFIPLAALGATTILVAAIIDALRSGERRDWMHWAGIGVFVAMAAPHLIETLLRWM